MTEKQKKAFEVLKKAGLTPVIISAKKIGTDYSMETAEGLDCGFQREYTSKKIGVLVGGTPSILSDEDFFRISK